MPHIRNLSRALVLGLVAVAPTLVISPANAQVQLAPAAAADAYGLDVDIELAANLPVNQGPLARATQESPPQAAAPDEAEVFAVGPVPAGGEVVQNVGVLTSIAGTNLTPAAVASSQAVDVRLLAQAGTPLITADVLRAQSATDCVNDPSAAGTEFVNLRVATLTDPITNPAPNTELAPQIFNPLGIKVIVNEQHPTADGRGLVVNAIHIYNYEPATVPGLFDGDIVVAHAMSTVNCPNGKTTTGGNNPVFLTKDVDRSQASPGDTLTYTAEVQNKSTQGCLVNTFIEHLPAPFELVSTAGAFGTASSSANRPGGGTDVIIKPSDVTIPAGGTVTQTFVVKVKDDAAPGVYFNNIEIFCANLGNWVKGLDAPVQISTQASPTPAASPQCSDLRDNDGDGKIDFGPDPGCDSPQDDDEKDGPLPRTGGGAALALLAGLAAATGAVAFRRRRTV